MRREIALYPDRFGLAHADGPDGLPRVAIGLVDSVEGEFIVLLTPEAAAALQRGLATLIAGN